ncbi:hypothetical protein [Silicimonas sp. MF1-12-2]|uniref:hypothetical protein n=1 Tax=Silicimonas sp. MF1-12-2 TaxID=3384793 RepID=UPI0039B52A35
MLAGGIATPAHAVIVDVIGNRGLFFVTQDYCEVEFRVGVRRDPAAEPDSFEPTGENLVIVLKDSSGAETWSRNHFTDSTEFTSGHFAYGEI